MKDLKAVAKVERLKKMTAKKPTEVRAAMAVTRKRSTIWMQTWRTLITTKTEKTTKRTVMMKTTRLTAAVTGRAAMVEVLRE